MTSQIILYKTEITPERNAKVDNIESYLTTCQSKVISDFQYIKIDLDITIKVDMAQSNTPGFNYNYLSVKREDDTKRYFYFILNSKWISANTISLQLSLDTINTFWNDLTWTKKTHITRQHKDRYVKSSKVRLSGYVYLQRLVDRFEEGITPLKTLNSSSKIESDIDCDHYLIYKSKGTEDTTPISCFYCTNTDLYVQGSAQNGVISSDYGRVNIVFYSRDNEDFSYTSSDGTKTQIGKNSIYKALLLDKKTATAGFDVIAVTDNGGSAAEGGNKYLDYEIKTKILENSKLVGYIFDTGFLFGYSYSQLLAYYNEKPSTRLELGTLKTTPLYTIYDVDRTDSKLVKIIKMPYAPFQTTYKVVDGKNYITIPNGWSLYDRYLKLDNLSEEFLSTVSNLPFLELSLKIKESDVGAVENSSDFESKLYNSNYYTLKYMYDNFEKELLLERTTPLQTAGSANVTPYVEIKFKQSNNISSNSLFDFRVGNVTKYEEPTLYSRYLNVNRSQEVALYTSPYLEYIRNGYNYDKKAQALQLGQSIAGTLLGVGTAVASFAVGGVGAAAGISFASSSINSLVSIITNRISSEQAIQQKLENARRSPASVSSTTDLNLLSYYNGNRLIKVTESCSDQVKQAIYNLFRLTGYACDDYAVPTFDTRLYYNFVQCKADFAELSWSYGQNILNDIKQRFEVGVTVFHKYNNNYDWLQEKENFEKWLESNT